MKRLLSSMMICLLIHSLFAIIPTFVNKSFCPSVIKVPQEYFNNRSWSKIERTQSVIDLNHGHNYSLSSLVPQNTVLIFDDFEDYATGTLPSPPWEFYHTDPYFPEQQGVVDRVYVSPSKSLHLRSANVGDFPAAVIARRTFNSTPIIGYQLYIRPSSFPRLASHISVCLADEFQANTGIGWSPYASVDFHRDTNNLTNYLIRSVTYNETSDTYDIINLQSFTLNTWYNVTIVLDKSTLSFNVWINGILRAQSFKDPSHCRSRIIDSLVLECLFGAEAYFDDAIVFSNRIPKTGRYVCYNHYPYLVCTSQEELDEHVNSEHRGWIDYNIRFPFGLHYWNVFKKIGQVCQKYWIVGEEVGEERFPSQPQIGPNQGFYAPPDSYFETYGIINPHEDRIVAIAGFNDYGDHLQTVWLEPKGTAESFDKGHLVQGVTWIVELHFKAIPVVNILSLTFTAGNSQFQTENSYLWVGLTNRAESKQKITILASTEAKGWSIYPSSLVVDVKPGLSFVAFLLNFTHQAESEKLNITIKETSIEKILELKIFLESEKKNLIALGIASSFLVLPGLYLQIIPDDYKGVEKFAEEVLGIYGLTKDSDDVDKAKAIFNFVVKHKGIYQRVVLPPRIDDIVKDIRENGGVSGEHKVNGDCKTFTIFYGGLAMALGLEVRPICSWMEASLPFPHGYFPFGIVAHSFLEIKLKEKWIFVDPLGELFNDTNKIDLPINLQFLYNNFNPKMTYELIPETGGPLFAWSYEGGVNFKDLTSDYKFVPAEIPIPRALVMFTQSPVNVSLYDEKGELLAIGQPYQLSWMGDFPRESLLPAQEGQFIVIENVQPKRYTIRLVGTGSGNFLVHTVNFNSTTFDAASLNGTVYFGKEMYFELSLSSSGELTLLPFSSSKEAVPYPIYILTILVLTCTILSACYFLFKKKMKKKPSLRYLLFP